MTLYGIRLTFQFSELNGSNTVVLRQLYETEEDAHAAIPSEIERIHEAKRLTNGPFPVDESATTATVIDFLTPRDYWEITFERLPAARQQEIREAILDPNRTVEVNCPWWPSGHWEAKDRGEPWETAFYRIK